MGPEVNAWKYFYLHTSLEGRVETAARASPAAAGGLSSPPLSGRSSPAPVKVRAISGSLIACIFDMIRL